MRAVSSEDAPMDLSNGSYQGETVANDMPITTSVLKNPPADLATTQGQCAQLKSRRSSHLFSSFSCFAVTVRIESFVIFHPLQYRYTSVCSKGSSFRWPICRGHYLPLQAWGIYTTHTIRKGTSH